MRKTDLVLLLAPLIIIGCPAPPEDDAGTGTNDAGALEPDLDAGDLNDSGTGTPGLDGGLTVDAGAPRDAGLVNDAGETVGDGGEADAGDDGIVITEPTLTPFPASTQIALDAIVSAAEADNNGFGAVMLRVESRSENHLFEGAAGQTYRQSGVLATAEMTMEIASVSKTFTAVAVLLLVDDGLITLDTLVATVLPAQVMADLIVIDGVERGGEIRVRDLLAHTSGLPHYWEDPPYVSGTDNAFILAFANDPNHDWSPEDILTHVKAQAPAGPPRAQFHYADGGYLLLGMIVEEVSGTSLETFYRDRLWDPLALSSAHLSYREDPRAGFGASHLYWGQDDMTGVQAMSADWAGGGLVMNARDMARFMFAVEGGFVLTPPSLSALKTFQATQDEGIGYGLGMYRVDYTQFDGYERFGEVYGHDGYGGAFMYYWPKRDLVLTGTLNHAENACFDALIEPVLFELDQ